MCECKIGRKEEVEVCRRLSVVRLGGEKDDNVREAIDFVEFRDEHVLEPIHKNLGYNHHYKPVPHRRRCLPLHEHHADVEHHHESLNHICTRNLKDLALVEPFKDQTFQLVEMRRDEKDHHHLVFRCHCDENDDNVNEHEHAVVVVVSKRERERKMKCVRVCVVCAQKKIDKKT